MFPAFPAMRNLYFPEPESISPAARVKDFLASQPSRTRTHHDAIVLAKRMESSAWQLACEAKQFEVCAGVLSSRAQNMHLLIESGTPTFQLAQDVAKIRTTQIEVASTSRNVSNQACRAYHEWNTIVKELIRTQPRRDAIQVLPTELFTQVLDELDHNDFLRCMSVNSSWAAAVAGCSSSARASEMSRRFLNNPGNSPARVTGPGTAVFRALRALATGNVQANSQNGAGRTISPAARSHLRSRNAADNISRLFAEGMAQHTLHLMCDLQLVDRVPLQRRWKAVLPAFQQVRSIEVFGDYCYLNKAKLRAATVQPTVEFWPKLRKVTSTAIALPDLCEILGMPDAERPITQSSLQGFKAYTLATVTGSRFLGPTGEGLPELKSLYYRASILRSQSNIHPFHITVLTEAENIFDAVARLDGSLSPQLAEVFTILNPGSAVPFYRTDEIPHGPSEACAQELWSQLCQPGCASADSLAKLDAARLALERFPRLDRWTLIVYRCDEQSSVLTLPLVGKLFFRLQSGPPVNLLGLQDSVMWS